jgi:ABC-type uncharacterized transport system ATPase subunit
VDAREVTSAPVLALRSVSRRFAAVQALDRVDLAVRPGQIQALLGENGAGKSTAIALLAGLDTPDDGTVEAEGAPVSFGSRGEALRRGVGLVPQTDSLVGGLTLVENLALVRPHRRVRRRQAAELLRTAAARAGVDLDVDVRARDLSRGQRQLGELTLALALGARVLLLDEPTSALGPHETELLFERVRALAAAGVAVVVVTHRLAEVRAVADTATVLSHGKVTFSGTLSDVDDETLVRTMVGDLPPAAVRGARPREGAVVLKLDQVSAACGDRVPVHDVTMEVRAGEVLGVLGVAGNGQRALAEAAAGRCRPSAGSVTAAGAVAYVPEDRIDGLLPARAAKWSAVLRLLRDRRFVRRGAVDTAAVTGFAAELLRRHDVRPPDPEVPVSALSGGNQQKLLVGRELDGGPAVAVLHGPTQGLDLRAARAIHAEITAAADAGTAVLLVSADLDEVRGLADRLVVLSRGRIVGEFPGGRFDDAVVRRLTTGLTE